MPTPILRLSALLAIVFLVSCGGSPTPSTEAKKDTPTPAAPPPDAGAITGKAVFTGEKPKRNPLSMDATPICAKMHPEPALSEEAIVGEGGAVKNVFVYVKSGLAKKDYAAPSTPVKLDQNGCVYTPHIVGVMTGQRLEISNSDDTNHNVHPLPRINREWNESQPPKGDVKLKTFDKEELPPILFKCNVHPWMRAWVGVVSHPFFAITADDGTFTIKDVPPGDYTVGFWHERFGPLEAANIHVGPKETATANIAFK